MLVRHAERRDSPRSTARRDGVEEALLAGQAAAAQDARRLRQLRAARAADKGAVALR